MRRQLFTVGALLFLLLRFAVAQDARAAVTDAPFANATELDQQIVRLRGLVEKLQARVEELERRSQNTTLETLPKTGKTAEMNQEAATNTAPAVPVQQPVNSVAPQPGTATAPLATTNVVSLGTIGDNHQFLPRWLLRLQLQSTDWTC